MEILRREDYQNMPWKNGAGETLEVLRKPEIGDFLWRLSFAFVTSDGDFSTYEGIDRTLTLVSGKGIHLEVDAEEPEKHDLQPFELFEFKGESKIHATVDGNTVDFNVMTVREQCSQESDIHRVSKGKSFTVQPPEPRATWHGLAVLDGELAITVDGEQTQLSVLDVVSSPEPGTEFTGEGVLQEVTILA